MSRPSVVLGWLEDKSDWLSPLVVKEVRQVVRGREFMLSFGASLAVGLTVAFFGAGDALSGNATSGTWTFFALTACLALLGLAVVPLGAFSALRNERMEQTFDLIMLTALSPRRIVVGKLMAQGVKLATLFAAIAPFIAMSFLLGGIDVVTILVSLAVLFMWSMWVGGLCLFLSTVSRSRAMSGLVFGGVAVLVLVGIAMGRTIIFYASRGGFVPGPFGPLSGASLSARSFATMTVFWLVSLVNLVLLAENRLSLSTEDTVTPLRTGLFVQFLLIVAWGLALLVDPALGAVRPAGLLLTYSGLHLALVAAFAVTDDLAVPRRVLLRMTAASRWRGLLLLFGPGGGRGAAYVLAQMALLIAVFPLLKPDAVEFHRLLAMCGFICFFTGVPAVAFWWLAPARATPLGMRVAVLLSVTATLALPDIVHYVVRQPAILNLSYTGRHLINPFRTLANWDLVESWGWVPVPVAMGLFGLAAYLVLISLGARATRQSRGHAND